MTILSAADLVKLRSGHPHVSRFYMSILKPTMVYKGQITGTPTFGSRVITVTDISGDITDVEAGFTVKVKDVDNNLVSKRRYRSRVGQLLTLDENTVNWSTTYTIEVYKQRELWTVFPYIDESDNYTFYKDYDTLYSDQNIRIPPVAIAGASKVGFLDGGSITFQLDASDSYIMAAAATAIVSYAWSCDEGVIADATSSTTTITFTTPGQYLLKLTVTDDLSSSQSTYRTIFVHERAGVNAPYKDFDIGSVVCSWSDGSCTTKIVARGSAVIGDVEDGAYVVIWSEDWYDSVQQPVGQFGNIKFAGYILSESVEKTFEKNEVTFNLGSVTELMKYMRMFSVSLEAVESGKQALTWYQFPYNTLTVARAIHHLWRWHSTLLEIADVYLPVSNASTLTACDDMTDGNLFTLVNWVYDNGIFAKLYSNQDGSVHLEQDCLMLDETARNALDTYMDIITKDFKFGDVGLQVYRRTDTPAALITASGVATVAGVYTALMSQAPGIIPGNYGDNLVTLERLVLDSQAQLNMISGRIYALDNSDISELRMELSGNYPVDISSNAWFTFTIPASFTHRGIDIDVRMHCIEVTYTISVAEGTIYPLCLFEVDVDSVDGITVQYPDDTETPYAPLPAYIPYIPYITGINPIYPLVPSQPAPNYPGAAPTEVPAEEPPIPEIDPDCTSDTGYEANGPFFLYSGTVYRRVIIPVRFWMRDISYTNNTRYTINGRFFGVDALTGEYSATLSDAFYTIYALDCDGVRIATGIHDVVAGIGYQRTGFFNLPAGQNICYIEIELSSIALVDSNYNKGFGDTYWDTAPYVNSTDVEIYSQSFDTVDGTLHQQLANFACGVQNPPWIWGYLGSIEIYADYTIPAYPQWFEVIANLYPSELGSPHWYITTPDAAANDTTYSINRKVKLTAPHVGFNGINTRMTSSFPGSPAGNASWLTLISTVRPLLYKLEIDSMMLWNLCGYE